MLRRKLSAILFAIILSLQVFAGNHPASSNMLSFGIEILKNRQTMIKANIPGSAINFSQKDFDRHLGKWQYSEIKILSLPEKEIGTLQLNGKEIDVGTVIAKKDLDHLILKPNSNNESSSYFIFTTNESEEKHQLNLLYSNEKSCLTNVSNLEFSTYKNVSIKEKINLQPNEKIQVEKSCRQGILTLNIESGIFTYKPKQNFVGTDCFFFTVFDKNGNYGETRIAFIRVEKAYKNLFFHDLINDEIHKDALEFCSKGIIDYELDENALPIFSKEKTISPKELQEILINAGKENKHLSYEVLEIFQSNKTITREQCVKMLKTLKN